MRIAVPLEKQPGEARVALVPESVKKLVATGAEVSIEAGAGTRAGFVDAECWLQDRPVQPDEPADFIRTVCLGNHLDRLPEELRPLLVERMVERVPKPLTLGYVRLNIDARRPE